MVLFAVEIDQVSVILPARVGTVALLDDAFSRNPAAQIGDATAAQLMCRGQPGWRHGIHLYRLGRRVSVMFAGSVSAYTPGTGSTVKPMTRLATAGCGIPSRIELEYSFWRDTNGSCPVEPITSDTGGFRNFTKLLRDFTAVGLGLLDLRISRRWPLGYLRPSYWHRLTISGLVKWTLRLILTSGSRAQGHSPYYEATGQRPG